VAILFLPNPYANAQETPPLPLDRPVPDVTLAGKEVPPEEGQPAEVEFTPPLPLDRPSPEPPPQEDADAEPDNDGGNAPQSDPEMRAYQAACPGLLSGRIVAEAQPPISDGICGIRSPLIVSAVVVNGGRVELTGAPVLNCRMAEELAEWANTLDAYSRAALGSGLAQILTGTAYQCRARNNQSGGPYSEHAFGNAIDITGVVLENGTRLALPEGWVPAEDGAGRFLRFAHDAACGQFTTVLGPETNALHRDHLHLDLGCHGQSCTYLLCE
jgi:hypothetical protein